VGASVLLPSWAGGWKGGRWGRHVLQKMASVLQIALVTKLENQEGFPYTFSIMGFNITQVGSGFLRPDEFLRQCLVIVILADDLSAFNS
jgi:hypothetical protein